MKTYLELRSVDVVHETLEEETVIIDLQTGSYYWAAGFASAMFLKALSGCSRQEVLEWATAAYPDQSTAAAEAKTFLDTLVASKLCVISELAPTEPITDVPSPPVVYSAPVMGGNDEMADLLLLDPIHEVDPDAGWPNVNADT